MPYSYQIGAMYSAINPTPGQEKCSTVFNDSLIDLVYYISNPSAISIMTWQHTTLRLGIFEPIQGIPIIVGEFQRFPKWSFNARLNVYESVPTQYRWWKRKMGNHQLTAILVNSLTNSIAAVRTIKLYPDFVRKLNQSLSQQESTFPTRQAVDEAYTAAYRIYPASDMVQKMKPFCLIFES